MKYFYLMLITMFFCCFSFLTSAKTVSTSGDLDTWELYATFFPTGVGTEQNPYVIETANHLAYLSKMMNSSGYDVYKDKVYSITKDIDLSSHKFVPMGSSEKPFKGKLYGNNHTIKGLSFEPGNNDQIGLFSRLVNAQVSNIIFSDINIYTTTANRLGVVAGIMGDTSNINNIILKSGSIINNRADGASNVGGIVGVLASESSGEPAGTIYNVVNYVNISNTYNAIWGSCGGIFGSQYNYAEVFNCINYGDIKCLTLISGEQCAYVGGIAGEVNNYYDGSVISNCYSKSNSIILGSDGFKGVVVGHLKNDIINTYGFCSNLNNIIGNDDLDYWGGGSVRGSYINTNLTSLPSGWDSYVWGIDKNINNGNPYLKWYYWQNNI